MMTDKLRESINILWDRSCYKCGSYNCDMSCEAALAEPTVQKSLTVAEPVAWLVTYGGLTHVEYTQPNMVVDTRYQPLYTAPLAEQKPMLEINPEKREWVGLTGDEIEDLPKDKTWWEIIRAAEEILKEKNT